LWSVMSGPSISTPAILGPSMSTPAFWSVKVRFVIVNVIPHNFSGPSLLGPSISAPNNNNIGLYVPGNRDAIIEEVVTITL